MIEMLVVLALFSTFLIMATDLFIIINRVQRETEVSERLLSENRFVMETIARLVRSGEIDYQAYGSPSTAIVNPVDELIVQKGNEQIRIKPDTNYCPSATSSPCVLISRDGGSTWSSMTPVGVKVINMRFIITPELDPFYFQGASYLASDQPMVTAVLGLGSTDEISAKYIEVNNQTSISSRQYGR